MSQHHQPTRSRKYPQHQPFLARVRHLMGGVILACAMALLAAPAQRPSMPSPQEETPPLQAAGGLQITMSPTLSPPFNPNISDYVVSYKADTPIEIAVNAPRNTKVAIDGQPFRKLVFTTQVSLNPGQSFSFVVNSLQGSQTYYVRCVPADFPTWTTERPETPQSAYYVIAPNLSLTPVPPQNYVILADNYGVPLWWYRSAGVPNDAKLLSNGNMAWTIPPIGEERRLDGSLVHTFTADTESGGTMDNHELLLLPNGDYVYIVNVNRGPVDLRGLWRLRNGYGP